MPYNDYDRGATAVRSDVSATAILINNSYMSLQQICNAANKSDYMSLHFVGRKFDDTQSIDQQGAKAPPQ